MALSSQSDTLANVDYENVLYEVNSIFTRESSTLTNDETTGGTAGAITLADPIGTPVKKTSGGVWQFASGANVTTGTATNFDGIVIAGPAITALAINTATAEEYTILARGPALINEGLIPTTDAYGDAIVEADYISGVNRLNIETVADPSTTTEQTT